MYEKTNASLTRNNIESAHKGSKTKTDSSLFTLKNREEQKGIKYFVYHLADNTWADVVNRLKAENLKLRQENIKLQVMVSERDQINREELEKVKDKSLKLIQQKEKEFEEELYKRDIELAHKIQELTEYATQFNSIVCLNNTNS